MCTPTWRYNQLIAQQRAIIVERNTLLRTVTAREELAELAPKRGYENCPTKYPGTPQEPLTPIGRSCCCITSTCVAGPIYPGVSGRHPGRNIHLRARWALAEPTRRGHRMAVQDAFASLARRRHQAAQQTFETANVSTSRGWTCQTGPADIDMDTWSARPVR